MNCHVSAAGRFFYKSGGGVAHHKHVSDFQMQLIYEGDAVEYCGVKTISVKPGDVVFVSQGMNHSFVAGKEGVKALELKFTVDNDEMRTRFSQFPVCFQDVDHQLYSCFLRVIMESQQRNISYRSMCDAILLEILVFSERICRFGSLINPDTPAVKTLSGERSLSPVVSAVNQYVYENLDRNFALEDLARGCGYNQDYIYRIIKKEFGISALQYINLIRFDQAKELIEHSELSLSEIAWNLGFESIQYFSRFFKKYSGMPPSEYLSKVRNTVRFEFK